VAGALPATGARADPDPTICALHRHQRHSQSGHDGGAARDVGLHHLHPTAI